jgi:phage host-nuclease inhibitor protein Gam
MGRPKKTAVAVESIADCTRVMAELLDTDASLEILGAERSLAVAMASESFESQLDTLVARRGELELGLRTYYYAHLAEMETAGAKSFQLVNGVMGRRLNPPSLKPLNRNWTWAAIGVRVRELWGKKYFHDPKAPDLDKDQLKTLGEEELKGAGLKVESEETFYAEPARLPEVKA